MSNGPSDGDVSRTDDELADSLLASAWPAGVPAEERALLASLTPSMRGQVLKRLSRLCRLEAGESPEALAKELLMDRSGFFKMRRRWTEEKSLAVLRPRVGRGGGRPKIAAQFIEPEQSAAAAERDSASTAGSDTFLPSHPTVRRIRREARRIDALRDDLLVQEFGRRFALDQSGLDIPISTDAGAEWAGAAFLIERQSGLILAARVDQLRNSERMALEAWAAGTSFAEDNALRVLPGPDGRPDLDVVEGEDGFDPQEFLNYILWLARVLPPANRHGRGNQRFGRFVIDSVGRSIGRIRMRPRARCISAAVPPAELRRRSAISMDEAQVLLDSQVKAHNAPIEENLVRLGLLRADADGSALRRGFPRPRRRGEDCDTSD